MWGACTPIDDIRHRFNGGVIGTKVTPKITVIRAKVMSEDSEYLEKLIALYLKGGGVIEIVKASYTSEEMRENKELQEVIKKRISSKSKSIG